jgi:Amt family ammonium transporter
MDASLGALLFGTAGYGFAYGDTGGMGLLYGVVGKDHFLLAKDDFETADGSGYMYASWMFQWALAATTCSIVSGAMCERTTLTAHVVFTMLLVGLIYPIVACVAWSEQGFLSAHQKDDSDRLFGCGMLDAAGSGVVHLTGGVAALVGVMVLGPRRAFLVNELEVPEYGPVFQTLGTLLLWFGWYGFNAVSTLHLVGFAEVAAKTMVTTTIAASGGALSALLTSTLSKGVDDETGSYRLRLEYGNKGALAGLVAISAGCSVMEPYGALITGLGAGPLYYFTSEFLVEYGIDDGEEE